MTVPGSSDTSQTSEPVLIAHAVTVILAAVVGLGWFAIPDQTIDLIGTVVFLLVSTVGAVIARGKVIPAAGESGAAELQAYVLDVVRQEIAAYQQYAAYQAANPPASALQAPTWQARR